MYDEELAPDIQEAARDKLREARRKKFAQPAAAWENSSPLPAVSPRSGLDNETGKEDVPPESEKEGRVARGLRERLEQKRQGILSMAERAEQAGKDAKHHAYRRYGQAKRIIRVVRLATLVGVSLGDIFFSLNAMALMVIGEWVYSKINPNYLMFDPRDPLVFIDKTLFYFALAEITVVALLAAAVIGLMVYLQSHPLEAAKVGWELLNI